MLTANTYIGIPNLTDTLTSFVPSISSTTGLRVGVGGCCDGIVFLWYGSGVVYLVDRVEISIVRMSQANVLRRAYVILLCVAYVV